MVIRKYTSIELENWQEQCYKKLYKIERVIWYEKYSYGYPEQNEDGDYILTILKDGGYYAIKI